MSYDYLLKEYENKQYLLKRNLSEMAQVEFFTQSIQNTIQPEELLKSVQGTHQNQVQFETLTPEVQMMNIRKLIEELDIRQACQCAMKIGCLIRYKEIMILESVFRDKTLISCFDLTKKSVFFGIIETIFSFNFNGLEIPYIQIRLLLDAQTFNMEDKKKDVSGLMKNNKELKMYSIKELILTDTYTFIQLKQITQKIHIQSSQKFALFDQMKKDSSDYFFMRVEYLYGQNKFEVHDLRAIIQCEVCCEFLDPMLQVKICQCQQTYRHFQNCSGIKNEKTFSEWDYKCDLCSKSFGSILEYQSQFKNGQKLKFTLK